MKRITYFFPLMMTVLLLLACQWAVAQNVAEFGRQEQETESLKLLKSEIDSITFELQASGDAYDQLIWTHDSLYRMNLTDDYGVKFSQVTLPDVYVLTEGIGDWSEMWISRQGNLMALKFKKNSEEILDNAALFISGEMGNTSHIACFDFYENGMPKSMLIDDNMILIRQIYDEMADVCIVLGDSITLYCDSIPLAKNGTSEKAKTRQEFAIQGTLEGVFEVLTGVIEGVVGAGITYTALYPTPLSPVLAATGTGLIAHAATIVHKGYNDLIATAEENMERSNKGIGVSTFWDNMKENSKSLDPEFVFEETTDKKSSIQKFWNKITDYAEKLRVKSLTGEEYIERIQGCLFAHRAKKVREESATLTGVFSSNNLFDNSSTCVKGFAIYPVGSKDYKLITIEDSESFEYEVTGLTPGTKYEYRAFLKDVDHYATVWSAPMGFITLKVTTSDARLKEDGSYELSGSVIGTENAQEKARVLFVYSTENKDPHVGYSDCNYITIETQKRDGDYSATLANIESNKTYYYRIDLEIDGEDNYGEVRSFGMNKFMGLTYEPLDRLSISGGTDGTGATIMVEYKISTRFRPNDLQSEPGIVLMQNGQILTKYALEMEKPGNETDLYTCTITIGLEKSDLNIDYENYKARTKDLYLAPCYNMVVDGKTMMAVFDEDKVKFDIIYEDKPEIKFTDAWLPYKPEIVSGEDGKYVAMTTYYYQISIKGAFWMKKATYKCKGASSSWNNYTDVPFETLMDGIMPAYPQLILVEYIPGSPSGGLSLQGYFDITGPYAKVIKSVNHLEFYNNNYYITGVEVMGGTVSSTRAQTTQGSETRADNPQAKLIFESREKTDEKVIMTTPEKWSNVLTLSKIKKQATIGK